MKYVQGSCMDSFTGLKDRYDQETVSQTTMDINSSQPVLDEFLGPNDYPPTLITAGMDWMAIHRDLSRQII